MDVNDPGAMAILVAPLVAQLKELLEPNVMVVGFAVKELMVGLPGALTVRVSEDVDEPLALVAVSV